MPRQQTWPRALRPAAVLILCLPAALSWAQPHGDAQAAPATFNMNRDREPMASLDGQWRFHPGDDPEWANPTFDDSRWPLISSTEGWSEQGYKNMSGLAWYRARVVIPDDGRPLSIYVPWIGSNYQIFVDGQIIGGLGRMPPHESAFMTAPRTYRLPEVATSRAHAALIAIRVWHWPVWASYISGGLQSGIVIGQANFIDAYSELRANQIEHEQNSRIIMTVLDGLAGLTALALFFQRRREKEYLWFAAALIAEALMGGFNLAIQFSPVSTAVRDHVLDFGSSILQFLLVGFYFSFLRARRSWFLWFAVGAILAFDIFIIPVYMTWPISVAALVTFGQIAFLPSTLWIDILIIRRAVQGFPDARLVMFPQLISDLWGLTLGAVAFVNRMGWSIGDEIDLDHVWQRPFPVSITDLVGLLFLLSMLAILIRRFARARGQEERMSGELEAARAVQHVLIPDEVPEVPGFSFQAVYKPANEVGGDFFQIIPTPDGGALIVIGDVSGKGMPAAMTVSLLVGTVRTLAHYTQSPNEILRAMNQRMLARSKGGFTTCLVLQVTADGAITFANAGHIPPYCGGQELAAESGLPLGLAAESVYPESKFQLDAGDRVTVLTDGVVEARSKDGILFGFDRTVAISKDSAEVIAQAACEFGQEDDITVLTITRVTEQVPTKNEAPVLSSSPA